MYYRNNVPILSPITETLVSLGMIVLVTLVWDRYRKRKNEATLYLAIVFTSYSTGVFLTALGKWLQFSLNIDPEVTSYADLFILIAYMFTAFSNIYLFAFIDKIFLDKGFRFALPITMLNSITIGLLIPRVSIKQGSYAEAFLIVLYHAANTIIIMVVLTYLALNERKRTEEKLPRTGFMLIAFYGIFTLGMFFSFGIDLALVSITGKGYTPFYYLSWILALFGLTSGYFGYIMPEWFRKLILKE